MFHKNTSLIHLPQKTISLFPGTCFPFVCRTFLRIKTRILYSQKPTTSSILQKYLALFQEQNIVSRNYKSKGILFSITAVSCIFTLTLNKLPKFHQKIRIQYSKNLFLVKLASSCFHFSSFSLYDL